jgi:methanogenic corrinoid protein MtbC1
MPVWGNALKLEQAVLSGDDALAAELTRLALDEGNQPGPILQEVLAPALQKVGQLWREGKFYMPHAVVSIDAFQAAKDILMAHEGGRVEYIGKVVIGTVAGNEHLLGKKMISGMLAASGFEVIDLGQNVPAQAFIQAVREEKPDVLGLGCYTSSAVHSLAEVVKLLRDSGLGHSVRVVIGGESTSQELADELGVDTWGGDVLDTVDKVMQLIGNDR